MPAAAIRKKGPASFEELKPACQILILHEDFPAYSRAVDMCRQVMERCANQLDFDVKCWNFIELTDPNCARHAAKTAGGAHIVLLSMHKTKLPVEVDRWLDFYFISRFRPEGTLVLLLNSPHNSGLELEKCVSRLAASAERLGMKFVSLLSSGDLAIVDFQSVAAAFRANPA